MIYKEHEVKCLHLHLYREDLHHILLLKTAIFPGNYLDKLDGMVDHSLIVIDNNYSYQ